MPIAFKAEKNCPECSSEEYTYFDKDEGKKLKRCFQCQDCGAERSEWKDR